MLRNGMLGTEIKKNMSGISFALSVCLLYLFFLMGDTGGFYADGTSTTVIGAIWGKLHGEWYASSASTFWVQADGIWNANPYLPVMMPLICGLPAVMVYLDEIQSGYKKFILARCPLRRYYTAKIVANFISSILTALFAIFLYDITLLLFFDMPSLKDDFDIYQLVWLRYSGAWVEDAGDISRTYMVWMLAKNTLYFCLYAMASASLCYVAAIWCREKYTAFGSTIFVCYAQVRIVEELYTKSVKEDLSGMGVAADLLNPVFLHWAGKSGFYQDKEAAAVLLMCFLTGFFCFLAVYISGRYFDRSE